MEIREIVEQYQAHDREWEQREKELEAKIKQREKSLTNTKKKLDKHWEKCPHWVDGILEPLAQAMLPHFPGRHYQILGPFGLSCETSIWFVKNGVEGEDRFKDNNILSVTFRPEDLSGNAGGEALSVVNEHINTQEYPAGTIGEMNGYNHPSVPMPNTIEGLVEWAKKK